MMLFGKSISDGNMSSEEAFLYAYGVYLSNGGTPKGFLEFTPDDVQIMLTSHMADRDKQVADLLKGIYKLMGGEKDL